MILKLTSAVLAALLLCAGGQAHAEKNQGHHHHHNHNHNHNHSKHQRDPVGVMGAHMHGEGEWMLSYRYMTMEMEGQRDGTDRLSPSAIALNVSNPFGPGGGNTRVVPTQMQMDMHMFGAMYGVTDWLTVMAMGTYLDNEMDHITYAGAAGNTERGTFTTESSGFGDTELSGLVRLYEDHMHHVHLNLGISLPTGSIDETDDVLAPTGARPTLRLPYSMQLGSGTYDALPGITYTGQQDRWFWGGQYMAEIRLEDDNDEGYALGNKHAVTGWVGYSPNDWLSGTARLTAETQDSIDGRDPQITAPVTTADPDNYGGEQVFLNLGASLTPTMPELQGHRFGVEVGLPVHRDLNGPQLERDYMITAGWSVSF